MSAKWTGKFLYVSYVSTAMQFSGLLRKVRGQTQGVARLGIQAGYTCMDGDTLLYCCGHAEKRYPIVAKSGHWRERQAAITQQLCEICRENKSDYVYLKGFLTNRYYLQVAAAAKQANPQCRVLFEIPTYPYWGEYRRFFKEALGHRDPRALAGYTWEVLQHAASCGKMKRWVDGLVLFGAQTPKLWGVPALTIDNGVTVDAIPQRVKKGDSQTVKLLGVAGTSVAHGYERVIEGLQQYSGAVPVEFQIVGANATIEALKKLVADKGLDTSVRFLGYQNAQGLAQLYCENDAAVSSLGVYRLGLEHLSPLKSREYCAAGIPFVYAYEDQLLGADTAFALKLPNEGAPVDIQQVVDFVQRCRADPDLGQQERAFAYAHYDWKQLMEQVLTFVNKQA